MVVLGLGLVVFGLCCLCLFCCFVFVSVGFLCCFVKCVVRARGCLLLYGLVLALVWWGDLVSGLWC